MICDTQKIVLKKKVWLPEQIYENKEKNPSNQTIHSLTLFCHTV